MDPKDYLMSLICHYLFNLYWWQCSYFPLSGVGRRERKTNKQNKPQPPVAWYLKLSMDQCTNESQFVVPINSMNFSIGIVSAS